MLSTAHKFSCSIDIFALDVLITHTTERGAFLEALKGMGDLDEVDVVVPPSEIASFPEFTEELRHQYSIPILSFGHAGDGNLHIYILRDKRERTEWLKITEEVMHLVYEKAKSLNGLVSGEHGIGFAKKPYLEQSLDPASLERKRSLKAAFDLKGLLNSGKVC